jgi:hypothetical protein
MSDKASYSLTDAQAETLGIAALMPSGERQAMLLRFLHAQGAQALLQLMVQFMGLANSVAENCRVMAEDLLVTDGGVHPYTAEKINMPTIFGAIAGVRLANSVSGKGLCAGCAYRLGTPANQCEPTTSDVTWCQGTFDAFLCHERLSGDGQPVNAYAGHAQALKALKAGAATAAADRGESCAT